MIGYPKYYILRFVASWSLLLLIFANFFGGSILISAALLTIFQSLRLSNSTMAKKKNPFLHGNSKTEIPDFG